MSGKGKAKAAAPKESVVDGKEPCLHCGQAYKPGFGMKVHMRSKHPTEKQPE